MIPDRKTYMYISQKFHIPIHLILGLFVYLISKRILSYDGDFEMIILSLAGALLPDLDHFIYIFWYGRKSSYATITRNYLTSFNLKGFLKYAKENHKNNTGLYSHNVLSMVFFSLLFVYFAYLDENIPGTIFCGSVAVHFIFDIFEDLLFFGKLNSNWLLIFNRGTNYDLHLKKRVKLFIKLIRAYQSLFSSIPLLFGYLLVKNFNPSLRDFFYILFLYLIFSVFLYGSVYIYNDLRDLRSDRHHPLKSKGRAVAASEITPHSAGFLAIYLLIFGLTVGYLIDLEFFYFELLFLLLNILYTNIFKNIPYLEIFGNSLTHPLRTVMGIVLAGGGLLFYRDLVITHFLGHAAITTGRRYREYLNGYLEARPVLKRCNMDILYYLQNIALILQLIHLIFTISSPGVVFRVAFASMCFIVLKLYVPNSRVKYVIDMFTYGKAR